ncbi:MAG: retron St85 family RNA-directed DNA polymerase [Parvibaculum sp.]
MLIEALQKQTGLPSSVIARIAETASKRYKTYSIPKRSGGLRQISHPSKELKAVQRWVCQTLIRRFPVHECATAYKNGASIRENAQRHASSSFTLRLDFEDFFPSFEIGGIKRFLRQEGLRLDLQLSEADIDFVGAIVTRYERVTIGAPSSPMLTNAMMCGFDVEMDQICRGRNLVYTRYADDIFISSFGPDRLSGMMDVVSGLIRQHRFVNLRIAEKKTAELSRKYRRSITGLVVTPDRRVSLGRERKRKIKSLVHRYREGQLPVDQIGHISGLVAFAYDVERPFFDSLVRKYGEDLMRQIQKPTETANLPLRI